MGKVLSLFLMGLSVCLGVVSAQGAEVDNFTSKHLNLPDQAHALNRLANRYLDNAIVAVNKAGAGCNEEVLFQGLKQVFANHSRGLLVKDILSQKHFPITYLARKDSVYRDWKARDGYILASNRARVSELALSPLIKIGDRDVGVDKLEHMFGMGHKYYRAYYDKNTSIDNVLSNGTLWEKTLLGGNMLATGVFSYADLSANFNGMRFWNNMLLKSDDILGSQYNRGPYVQCVDDQWIVNKSKPIDFRDYVDESFDESVNCSKMATRGGRKKFAKQIQSEQLSDVVKCEDNKELLQALSEKYSPHGIHKYILNASGLVK
ncbi:MAG: hypothetical protein ACKOX6_05850 [Bdellovibrio sp.]